ncbi:MAG: hypothetical protein ACRDPX_01370 [Gaiellaceae bacterium]
MRRALVGLPFIVLSIAMLGLTATGFAGGSASSSASQYQYGGPGHAGGPAQDNVYGGGRFGNAFTDGATPFFVSLREFSIDAHANPIGGGAYGTYAQGNPANGNLFAVGEVTCLDVDENSAVAGGYIRESIVPDNVGRAFFVFFKDFGRAGSGTLDRGSAFFSDFPDSPALPEGFPRKCELVESNAFGFGHVAFTAGDVVIHDE